MGPGCVKTPGVYGVRGFGLIPWLIDRRNSRARPTFEHILTSKFASVRFHTASVGWRRSRPARWSHMLPELWSGSFSVGIGPMLSSRTRLRTKWRLVTRLLGLPLHRQEGKRRAQS
jgi:hypothetical protein